MKKITILAILFAAYCTSAQIEKGKIMLGGTVDFLSSDQHSNQTISTVNRKFVNYGSNINMGYFVDNYNAVGFLLGYSYSRSEHGIDGSPAMSLNESNSWSTGIFGRHYVPIKSPGFYFFGQLAASVGTGNGTSVQLMSSSPLITQESRSSSRFIGAAAFPGISYFITKNFAVELGIGSIGYSFSENKNTFADGSQSSDTNSGFYFSLKNIFIGFNFYL